MAILAYMPSRFESDSRALKKYSRSAHSTWYWFLSSLPEDLSILVLGAYVEEMCTKLKRPFTPNKLLAFVRKREKWSFYLVKDQDVGNNKLFKRVSCSDALLHIYNMVLDTSLVNDVSFQRVSRYISISILLTFLSNVIM